MKTSVKVLSLSALALAGGAAPLARAQGTKVTTYVFALRAASFDSW